MTDVLPSRRPASATAPSKPARSVVDFLVEAIRTGVLEGRYAPGQRMVESDLTEEYGVSRGPLREALRRLAADGVVEITPHRGAAIRRPSREEMNDLFRVREALEGLAARLAAEHIDRPGMRVRLEAERQALQASRTDFDALDYVEDNERFHGAILEVAGSQMLERMLAQLRMPAYRAAFFRLFRATNQPRSIRQHAAILDAIMDGDGDRAEREMRAHISDSETLSRSLSDTLFRS